MYVPESRLSITEPGHSDRSNMEMEMYNKRDFYIGVGLAIGSSIFIGSSFIIKKKGLLKLSKHGSVRAGSGGYGYLKEWIWWAGLLTMAIGEAANFVAYAFAPASVVTPLGALSVLVSSVLASKLLNEHLNLLGKIGCCLCLLGSTVIIIHSPDESAVGSMDELWEKIRDPVFVIFAMLVSGTSLFLIAYCSPRHGQTNVLVYVSICSLLGSFTVLSCKAVGIAVKQTLEGEVNQFANWLTWAVIIVLVTCVALQMNYLNKALDIFNTSVVTPIYYVFFTTCVIVASGILLKEWLSLDAGDILGNLCGFLTIVCGIFMIHAFRNVELSLSSLQSLLRREVASSATSEPGTTTYLLPHPALQGSSNNSGSDVAIVTPGKYIRRS